MKKGIAIVGATGFIGSEILSLFKKNAVTIYPCSKTGGKIQEINIDSIDITINRAIIDWLSEKNIDTLIYLSSIIPKSFAETDWALFDKNLKMHKTILDAWKEEKFHLIYASSCSVYSRITPCPWSEMTIIMPDNYYSISKFFGEILFCKEFQMDRLPLTILRINAPYGIGNRIKTVMNIFLERSMNGEDLILYGRGTREQDFIYVKDVARAFWQAYCKKKYGIYNIASGTTVTMNELAHLIVDLTHSESKIIHSGTIDPQEGLKVSIDISKSQNELDFFPQYSLTDGLLDCIHEYQKYSTER
jgi:nucleoside-diphosphate-sugar epimerase